MKMFVYAEPSFKKTLWFSHIFRGMAEEAERKRYPLVLLDNIPDDNESMSLIFEGSKPVLAVVGASIAALSIPLARLWENGVHTVLVNFRQEIPVTYSSALIMDYADAVCQGIGWLREHGDEKIALLGGYIDSGPDVIKIQNFISEQNKYHIPSPERDVFSVVSGLADCCNDFFTVCENYDAILCCNDLAAVAVSRGLHERGLEGQLRMVGFVDPLISDFSILAPGIVTLSAEHYEFGRQAVLLYSWLAKNPSDISATVRIPVSLHVTGVSQAVGEKPETIMGDLSGDRLADEILKVERCMSACDDTDRNILRQLLLGTSRADIAQAVYVSERTVNYRLHRLCEITQTADQTKLLDLLRPWLHSFGGMN